jgi:hypothetical protein
MQKYIILVIFIIYILYRLSTDNIKKSRPRDIEYRPDITSSRFPSPLPNTNLKLRPEDEIGILTVPNKFYDH